MISFKGLDELQAKLKDNVSIDDVKRVVKDNSVQLTNNAQRLAPTDTGHMKSMTQMFTEDGGLTGGVRSHTNYAGYVDKGTRFMSARPFIGDSFRLQVEKFKRDMEMLVK